MYSVMISKFGLPCSVWPNVVCYSTSLAVLFTALLGRWILKANNDKKELRLFAWMVLLYLVLQNVVNYRFEMNSLELLAKLVKVDLVDNFDDLPEGAQRIIEQNQQAVGCCGVFDWRDYNKAPTFKPGKWMNFFVSFAALI